VFGKITIIRAADIEVKQYKINAEISAEKGVVIK
jgi:hypothetical protein